MVSVSKGCTSILWVQIDADLKQKHTVPDLTENFPGTVRTELIGGCGGDGR